MRFDDRGVPDRQLFQERHLSNGARVVYYPKPDQGWDIRVMVPVGYGHNVHPLLPGSFHVLEHLKAEYSPLYPDGGLRKDLRRHGCFFSAATHLRYTVYRMYGPPTQLPYGLERLFAHVFGEPVFTQTQLAHQLKVIQQETRDVIRNVGSSPLEEYRGTKWMHLESCPLRQKVGQPADHAQMTLEYLAGLHRHYFSEGCIVAVGGPVGVEAVAEKVEALLLHSPSLTPAYNKVEWAHREYHEVSFPEEVGSYWLYLGGIHTFANTAEYLSLQRAVEFLLYYLTSISGGPLWTWLRDERHHYDVDFTADTGRMALWWTLYTSTGSYRNLQVVRRQIGRRIMDAIGNRPALQQEADEQNLSTIHAYSSLTEIMDTAQGDLERLGRTVSEREWHDLTLAHASPEALEPVVEAMFNSDCFGELLVRPR